MKLWRAAVAAWRAPVSTSQRRNPSRSYLWHNYVGIRAVESPTGTAQKAAPTHMRMARAEAGCVRSACTTRSRTMAIRLTLLTTEWLFLHCGAHTAKPKIGVKDTDSADQLLPKSAGGFGTWRDA